MKTLFELQRESLSIAGRVASMSSSLLLEKGNEDCFGFYLCSWPAWVACDSGDPDKPVMLSTLNLVGSVMARGAGAEACHVRIPAWTLLMDSEGPWTFRFLPGPGPGNDDEGEGRDWVDCLPEPNGPVRGDDILDIPQVVALQESLEGVGLLTPEDLRSLGRAMAPLARRMSARIGSSAAVGMAAALFVHARMLSAQEADEVTVTAMSGDGQACRMVVYRSSPQPASASRLVN